MSACVHKLTRMLTPGTFKVEITQAAIIRRTGSKKGAIFMIWNTQSNEKEQTTDRSSLCTNLKTVEAKLKTALSGVGTAVASVGAAPAGKGVP